MTIKTIRDIFLVICVIYTIASIFWKLVGFFLGKVFGSLTKAEKSEEKYLRRRHKEELAPPIAGGPIL